MTPQQAAEAPEHQQRPDAIVVRRPRVAARASPARLLHPGQRSDRARADGLHARVRGAHVGTDQRRSCSTARTARCGAHRATTARTTGSRGSVVPDLRLTHIGGPTLLIEVGGLRLLTDPTFDAAGAGIRQGAYELIKTEGPAMRAESVGHIDAVLLSHDHHFDNLDDAGRALLASARSGPDHGGRG